MTRQFQEIKKTIFTLVSVFTLAVTAIAGLDVSSAATGGSGTVASPYTGWETAVNNASANTRIYFPSGVYSQSTTISMKIGQTIYGDGKNASFIVSTFNSNSIESHSAINSSTGVFRTVRDLCLVNYSGSLTATSNSRAVDFQYYATNTSNTGAGFDEVGGTEVELTNVRIIGFKYGVIFDQTEMGHIDICMFEQQLASGAGIWLVNGAEHTANAASGYTNVIHITRNNFNQSNSTPGIVDEGGDSHVIENNHFGAGLHAIYLAGANAPLIQGNYIEATASDAIKTWYTGYFVSANQKGGVQNSAIRNNFIVPASGQKGISGGYYTEITNNIISTSGTSITDLSNAYYAMVLGNYNSYGGTLTSGTPTTYVIQNNGTSSDNVLRTHTMGLGGSSDLTWASGAGAPASGNCTSSKRGALYTNTSNGQLYVCEGSGTPAWVAK